MLFISFGFFAGMLVWQIFTRLPLFSPVLLFILLVIGGIALKLWPAGRFFVAMGLGAVWFLLYAQLFFAQKIPMQMINQNVQIKGYIHSLPQTKINRHEKTYQQFDFMVFKLYDRQQIYWRKPVKIRLNWYSAPALVAGQQWQLEARLKPPHGYRNEYGQDQVASMISHGLHASGTVGKQAKPIQLNFSPPQQLYYQFNFYLQSVRAKIQRAISDALADHPQQPLIQTLVLGEKTTMQAEQWQILRQTGTLHLMAISGLHIGLAAFFGGLIGHFFWRLWPAISLWLPTAYAVAGFAWLFALFYALLAGFSLPTQRALIMLTVFFWGVWRNQRHSAWQIFSLSLLWVLIIQPFAVLSPSFYLSFTAVGVILVGFTGKAVQHIHYSRHFFKANMQRWWHKPWLRSYWVIFIGLAPLIVALFQALPLFSLPFNLVAIPWVSFLVVPLALLAVLMLPFSQTAAADLFQFSADNMQTLWLLLAQSNEWPQVWQHGAVPWVWGLCAFVGGLILLLPRHFPARWTGLIFLLPWLSFQPKKPPANSVWLDVLDVGQGLAVVARTQNHTLLYDTGIGSTEWSMAKQVVLPFLQGHGVKKLDALLISHGDNDHSGGVPDILAHYPKTRLISPVYQRWPQTQGEACAQQTWWWDEVRFEVLYPPKGWAYQGNNSSCVLKISHAKGQILLTADLEKLGEYGLWQQQGDKLKADILLVPHHGSRTSSLNRFVQTVAPRYAVFSTGYFNQWQHPHQEVVARYQRQNALILNTATQGQIHFRIDRAGLHPPIFYPQTALLTHAVVGGFFGDGDIVNMAFGHACVGDADKLRLGTHFSQVRTTGITHAGT